MSNLDDILIVTETQEKLLREVEDCLSDENDLVKEIAIILREALLKPKAAILDTLREDLIPDVLYIPAALKKISLFKKIRSIILAADESVLFDNRRGVSEAKKVASVLYAGEDSILAEATEFMEQYRQNLRTAQTSSGVKDASGDVTNVVTTNSVPVKTNLSRQKTAVSMIFKEDDTNFSGSQQTKVPLHEVRDAFVTAMTV